MGERPGEPGAAGREGGRPLPPSPPAAAGPRPPRGWAAIGGGWGSGAGASGPGSKGCLGPGGGGWGEKPKHILGFGSNMCWLHGLPIGGGITRAVSRSCFSARLDLHRRRVGIEISAVNVKQKASPHLLRALAGFRGFSSLPGDAVFVLVCLKGYKMGSQCNYKRHKVV